MLRIRLTPRGGRDAIDGITSLDNGQSVIKARVAGPPEDGKANAALIRLLAKVLHIPASTLTITAGHTARLKTVAVTGDVSSVQAKLELLFGKDAQ